MQTRDGGFPDRVRTGTNALDLGVMGRATSTTHTCTCVRCKCVVDTADGGLTPPRLVPVAREGGTEWEWRASLTERSGGLDGEQDICGVLPANVCPMHFGQATQPAGTNPGKGTGTGGGEIATGTKRRDGRNGYGAGGKVLFKRPNPIIANMIKRNKICPS